MKYIDLFKNAGFSDPYDTCLNIRTKNFDYNLSFISFETEDKLGILETDENGREKLKIISKEYIECVEVVYADDIIRFKDADEPTDKMFG